MIIKKCFLFIATIFALLAIGEIAKTSTHLPSSISTSTQILPTNLANYENPNKGENNGEEDRKVYSYGGQTPLHQLTPPLKKRCGLFL